MLRTPIHLKESFVQYIRPERSEILTVMDDTLATELKKRPDTLVAGVLSPAASILLKAVGLRIAAHITEPTLEAILEVGQGSGAKDAVVRPYYAASYGT
jgi:hypothetical protein